MITYITHVKVRETIINVALKRFASVIRTIRRQTVSNVRKSYPQVIHRRRRTCVRRGGGGGANVCSSRRAPKRFLQIFKTRVIISYRIALSIVFQSYPPYSKAIHRIPKLSSVLQSYPSHPQLTPTNHPPIKVIPTSSNVVQSYPTSSKVIQ